MIIISKEEHISFIDTYILKQVEGICNNDKPTLGFMVLSQGIEIIGAYLDSKPIRAKQQSMNRFSLAINRYFPKAYRIRNKNNFLYYQLRTCLTHLFIPTSNICLEKGEDKEKQLHLSNLDGVVHLFLTNFYCDFCSAISQLKRDIEFDRIKLKRISIGEIKNS